MRPQPAAAQQMTAIEVSHEMLALVGAGRVGGHDWPQPAVALEVDFGSPRTPASFIFHERPTMERLNDAASSIRLILLVSLEACDRLLGRSLDFDDGSVRYLPAEMNSIAIAIRDCSLPEAACVPYRLAKSIELLCEILSAHGAGLLTEIAAGPSLSLADVRRIAAARKLIDDHWNEKLTLGQIARRCGLNRSKLAKGFRELYSCTVSEALAERRLAEAQRQLISTDLPVGLIGYRSGYHNNASFTRAFGRRFGVSPSSFRACGLAA